MTATGFERAHKRTLVHEGGYANHPADPGGVTLQGVIQRVYDAYRDEKGRPRRPLRASMINDADWIQERDDIYRRQYWNAIGGDRLPEGVDYVVYDGAVNSGPKQSIKWLQRALGFGPDSVDGVMGIRTWTAIRDCDDYDALIERICDRRRTFLRQLKHYPKFKTGWERRVSDVERVGQLWATGDQSEAPPVTLFSEDEGGHQKASIADAAKVPSPASGDLSTGGGVGLGSITGIIEGLRDQLTPFTGSELVSNVVLALGLAAALLTIGGLGYRFYARWKRDKAIDALDLNNAVAAGVV